MNPLLVLNPSEYGITRFVQESAKRYARRGDIVLDAGAGLKPYKRYFNNYHSTDMQGNHTFLCSLDRIPLTSGCYDVVLNNQVLEHISEPAIVLKEFQRILKPQGKLIMTVPQGYGVHSDSSYFNFLPDGIVLLLRNAGFQVEIVKPLGGIYRLMGKLYYLLPWYIFRQYLVRKGYRSYRLTWQAVLFAPFFVLSLPLNIFFAPLIFMALDSLDKQKDWTLTYGVVAVK